MRYIMTINPPAVGWCYVLSVKGNWQSRHKDDLLRDPSPGEFSLQYFASEAEAAETFRVLSRGTYPEGELMAVALSGEMKRLTLSEIQKELENTWTLQSYSPEFKAGKRPYRDFEHTLLHVMKATGKLVSMVEEADHGGESFPPQRVADYLADLVICGIRMASKHPYGAIDIENAVIARIREKADVPEVG
jgi:hypothetical protein